MGKAQLILGSSHIDERGTLKFFNNLNLQEIVRFYEITPSSVDSVRAWQGHKIEKKWFYCVSGSFVVNLIAIDDFENPSVRTKAERFILNDENPTVLEIPSGYANGFKAHTEGSKLLVFSNFSLERSQEDDFRYPPEKWAVEW